MTRFRSTLLTLAFGLLAAAGSSLLAMDPPHNISVDSAGRIYVGEEGTGSVSVFLPNWSLAGRLGQGAGEFKMPNHIVIPSNAALAGMVFVSDSRSDLIKVYSPGGVLVRQFGGSGNLDGQFNFPTGIFVDAGGEVFVADAFQGTVRVIDAQGNAVSTVGGFGDGPGEFQGPQGGSR